MPKKDVMLDEKREMQVCITTATGAKIIDVLQAKVPKRQASCALPESSTPPKPTTRWLLVRSNVGLAINVLRKYIKYAKRVYMLQLVCLLPGLYVVLPRCLLTQTSKVGECRDTC